MNTRITLTLSAVAVAAALATPSVALAGLSGNVGVTSNYIWRGKTQTDDAAAISGGLDYDFGNGFSVGTWTSNVDFPGGVIAPDKDKGYELDLYGGYAGKMGSLDYGLGITHYAYPIHDNSDLDFTEFYGNLGFGPATFGVAYTFNADDDDQEGNIYYSLGASTDIKEGLSLGGTVGRYDFDTGNGDYTHYQVNLSKGDFTFAVDDNNTSDSDPVVSVSWAHALDL